MALLRKETCVLRYSMHYSPPVCNMLTQLCVRTRSLSLSLSLSHAHTHAHSLSLTHTQTYTRTHTEIVLSQSEFMCVIVGVVVTHTLTHSLTHLLSLTHTHVHTHRKWTVTNRINRCDCEWCCRCAVCGHGCLQLAFVFW